MKKLTSLDLEYLSLGSALLGSGGGGDPFYSLMMAKYQFTCFGPFSLMNVEELSADDLVVPLALMGAPLINKERILGNELESVLTKVEKHFGRPATVVMAGEIGGANAFAPLLAAKGLPILDADLIGRAFPELQMNICHLLKHSASPAFLADPLGNSVMIETKDVKTLENFARGIAVSMGSSAALALHIMDGNKAKKNVLAGTFSRALTLGKILYEARKTGKNPAQILIEKEEAILLGRGTLIHITQEIKKGFLEGCITLLTEEKRITLFYQNEYLIAHDEKGILASTPDILMLIEEQSGTPLTSELLKYGLQVSLVALSAPQIWKTKEGLDLVGPQVFGYVNE